MVILLLMKIKIIFYVRENMDDLKISSIFFTSPSAGLSNFVVYKKISFNGLIVNRVKQG